MMSYKIPIYPLHFSVSDRLNMEYMFKYTIGFAWYHGFCNITALEDSTVVYSCRYNAVTDTILLDLAGQSVVINLTGDTSLSFEFETNCKKFISYSFFQYCSWPLNASCDIQDYITSHIIPLAYSRHLFTGSDFLCKKLHSNRFDKGIALINGHDTIVTHNSGVVSAYSFNEYIDDYLPNVGTIPPALPGLTTSESIPYYGDTTHYINVPFSFLRSSHPRLFSCLNGPLYIIHKSGRHFTSQPYYGIVTRYPGCGVGLPASPFTTQPAERMVKRWVYPTTRDNLKRTIVTAVGDTVFVPCDSLYVDVQIYTHADGIGSTYFNGQLIPATAFDTFPRTNGEYWVAQLYFYNGGIPELIRIENEHGFSAYVDEFGYDVGPAPAGHTEIDDITYLYYYHSGAAGCYSADAYQDNYTGLSLHNGDTVYRCIGDTLRLKVEHNPDSVPIEWIYDGDSYMVGVGTELSFPLPDVDTLAVQLVFHYDGCPDTSTTLVVVVPPPFLEMCHDTTLCRGAQLSVQQPNVISYRWSDGSCGPAIAIDSAGTYSVTVTNLGCRGESDLFNVGVYPQSSVGFGNDTILCEVATLLLDATQSHPATYEWQDHSTNTTYTVIHDGDYWVVVTDHCLGASDTIAVEYLRDFEVNLGADTTLCEGDELVLVADLPFCRYIWQDGSTEPRFVVRQPGIYSVTATNFCYSHSDDIDIAYEPCAQELWVPNSFTPDGDGLNDRFVPVFSYPGEVEQFEMMVYDRWGSMVFLTTDMDAGWDGGDKPEGMYVWVIRYKTALEGMRIEKGSVMLGRR